ncbi:MAG: serine hydrolase [Pseudomonadota bacterium]
MRKVIYGAAAFGLVAAAVTGVVFKDRFDRARAVGSLFTGAEQYQNFHRYQTIFPHTVMDASPRPFQFPDGAKVELPSSFVYSGQTIDTDVFLSETDTAALLVIDDGQVRFERYSLTGGRDVPWISMSVAKSFISALVGIAVSEGLIGSIDEDITSYVPELAGSAYDGVRIKDILQMSSGARWNEDYSDPNSDIARFGQIFALGGSLDEFAGTLERAREPGTFNLYNSTDTHVLGMMLVRATGQTISHYMEEKLWRPMGSESDGYWLLDGEGMEMAFGGMTATARDYAKIGELYRLKGVLNGQQIVPTEWVAASVTPDAPHLQPGKNNPATDFELGYGYQWWIPEGDEGEFSAIGVYNQFVYVNPTSGTVIVKLSANSNYGTSDDESAYRELETIEFFRSIVNEVR